MVSSITSTIFASKTKRSSFDIETFRHPTLTEQEHKKGTRLGIDSWADSCCSGKHAYVESFIEGKFINATGFSASLGKLENLPIANVLYAYDCDDGSTIILENNNTIYMGDDMIDSLVNPIHMEESNVHVDIRPRRYYNNEPMSQQITFHDGFTIPVMYDGVLPYIPIRRPTTIEIEECNRYQLTNTVNWNPHSFDQSYFASVSSQDDVFNIFNNNDTLSISLLSQHYPYLIDDDKILFEDGNTFHSIDAIQSKFKPSITPEYLSKLWNIGLQTAKRTLLATTHKCIRTTGTLTRRFRTDHSQLKYKQLRRQHGTFYADFVKSKVKSLRGFIGGVVYTNKLGFISFFPTHDERSTSTASTLKAFVDIVGLPYSLHTDNHGNFKDGSFKQLVRKLMIPQSFTKPHSPWQNRAEYAIGELMRYTCRLMQSTLTPIRLWCFCFKYAATILCLCTTGCFALQG